MQGFCIQKTYISSSIYDSITQLYRFCIVCSYIIFMYIKQKKAVSVSQFYRFCIAYTMFVCTKNILFNFQAVFSLNFVQVLYSLYIFLYICRNLMYIFCTFIIIQNFDLCNLCIKNIYKFSVLHSFCIHFVQFMYKYLGKGSQNKQTFCKR